MKIHPSSAWSASEIESYLERADTPMRISVLGSDGYPLICSLWFVLRDGSLWAASHKNSHIVKVLEGNPKIGFEVATNEYPYHGVRGRAQVSLHEDSEENILEQLIDKYLQGTNQKLAAWLLSRKKDEYALKIVPIAINSWDFSDRMER